MRHIIMACLAGALLAGIPAGAQAQYRGIDATGGIERGDRAERLERRRERAGEDGLERRGGRAERGEQQAQRYEREDGFERRGGFDRGYGDERRVIIRRERVREPVVVERRFVRPPRARTVCTTRIRERVTPGGVVIRRPVEVCRQNFGAL
ncbi:hypothetical protein [Salinarimonas soli]|uniref:Uncharacterized protein n=1 Tax=Salinarimonas soli TaxID=1638099 RepID=A0A5B2V8F9_9HYPH|nr:hypothetical protein [Salinarimonas soli]KAA2235028.1 hypothetical protein F0L46_22090 [Salinarimonas soli]